MTSDDAENGKTKPEPGPGVRAWLAETLGAPKSYRGGSVTLPQPFSRRATGDVHQYAVPLGDLMKATADGNLRRLEVRDVPDHVELSAGSFVGNGVWSVPPSDTTGLSVQVPADVGTPFTVTVKAVFEDDADGSSWTEVSGVRIGEAPTAAYSLPRAPSTPATEPAPQAEPASEFVQAASGPEMSIIDLDVSVGIDDPDVLSSIVVRFGGLPLGTFLTAGRSTGDGTWEVTADHLQALSIVSPLGEPDFDLSVILDDEGGKPQSAMIEVTNDDDAESDAMLPIQLGFRHAPDGMAVRLMIFTDGMLAYDRAVIPAPQEPDIFSVGVPFEDGLPFELVVRHTPLLSGEAVGPVFVSCRAEGIEVNAGEAGVDVRAGDHPGTWHGDLVIDVRRAMRNDRAAEEQPGAEVAVRPADDPVDLAAPDEPSPVSEPVRWESEDAQGTLRVNASLDDISNDTFLAELRRLGDFVRAHAVDDNSAIYSRLALDVAKWKDMEVVGPLGALVDLDPRFPRLAPPGGRDNTRAPQQLSSLRFDPETGTVRVVRLPPGALLTAGKNVGDGCWELPAEELARANYVAPAGERSISSLRVETSDDGRRILGSLLATPVPFSLRPERQGMTTISVRLDASVFDPEGYGALSLTLGDVPAGVMLSAGSNHGDGVWTAELTAGEPLGVCVRADAAPFDVTLTCIAMKSDTGESTVVTRRMTLSPRLDTCQLAEGLAA